MMHILSDKLQKTVYISFLGLSLMVPVTSQASLVGDTVSIGFFDGSGNIGSFSDNITVGAGYALASGDGTKIGTNVLLDGEYINITDGLGPNTGVITFNFQGGGAQLAAQPSYNSPNYYLGDYFTISGLFDNAIANGHIASLTLSLANAVNVTLNTDVFFTGNSITLNLAQIGILNTQSGAADYGSVTLDLQFAPTTGTVPTPSTILLLIPGLALFRFRAGLMSNTRVLAAL